MQIKKIITIETINYIVPWEVQHSIDMLRRKLRKYIIKKQNGNYYYELDDKDSLCDEIYELKKQYKEEVELFIQFKVVYSEEEINKAVAFIPKFKNIQLEEYGDDNMTHIDFCSECNNSNLRKKLIANPDGQTKKMLNEEYVIKCGEEIDVLYGISRKMFDNINERKLKNSFKPIYSKGKKEPFGYAFYGMERVSLFNDNYVYDEPCDCCGTIYAEEKDDIEEYCNYYVLEEIDFSKEEVVFSKQYYYGNQVQLVSPELYRYIKSRIETAEFVPVFLKEC